jgi:CheY-like chemotaxis protein
VFVPSARKALSKPSTISDADTTSPFTEISRSVGQLSWFIESQHWPQMNNDPCSHTTVQRPVDNFGPVPVTTPFSDLPLALANTPRATSAMIDKIEIRVNEGGVGDEVNSRVLRVMVVEDEAVIAILMAEVLAGMGHDVCAIEATEADAVAAAVRCKPEMMIIDARLGDGSGISAVEQILCSGFIPHVFVSGDALRVQALCPGAVVIQKPFRESDLASAMQRALGVAAAS